MIDPPLAGVRVLDASRVLAGPAAAYLLGLLGAEVTRIERPPLGDSIRWRERDSAELGRQGLSTDYLAQAAGKRLLYVDLATGPGRNEFDAQVADCDVVVENFRPSSLQRLGINPAAYRARHPRLVWCSVSGFGRSGPRGDRPAYDHVVQAASGLMALTGTDETGPMKIGAPVLDYATGTHAALAVLAALLRRHTVGHGAWVEASLLDGAFGLMRSSISAVVNGTSRGKAVGNRAGGGGALSRLWDAADGPVAIAINEPHQRTTLAQAVGCPSDVDDWTLATRLQLWIGQLAAADAERQLGAVGVPCAAVQTLPQALAQAETSWRCPAAGLPFSLDGWRGCIGTLPEPHTPVT